MTIPSEIENEPQPARGEPAWLQHEDLAARQPLRVEERQRHARRLLVVARPQQQSSVIADLKGAVGRWIDPHAGQGQHPPRQVCQGRHRVGRQRRANGQAAGRDRARAPPDRGPPRLRRRRRLHLAPTRGARRGGRPCDHHARRSQGLHRGRGDHRPRDDAGGAGYDRLMTHHTPPFFQSLFESSHFHRRIIVRMI